MISVALLLLATAPAPDLVDVTTLDTRFTIDIKYATTDNFTGKQLYPVARCLLRKEVGAMVVRAQQWLDAQHPGYVFLFKDCYRPERIQYVMWEAVKGTPKQSYVKDPSSKTGSVHNYGAAVDITLRKDGAEVDMGTPYDFFGELAEPRHEERFVKGGKLSPAQVTARHILRDALVQAGFHPLPNEWWHFDAWKGAALTARYQKLDIPLEAVP
jgi:zinc D-Ala-D-Ala dipeptidase